MTVQSSAMTTEVLFDDDLLDFGREAFSPPNRRRTAHRIASVSFPTFDGPASAECTCGKCFDAPSPEDLYGAYVTHTGRSWGFR